MAYNFKKILKGNVISNKMNKSAIITVKRKIKHKVYDKYINKISKFMLHDENNECKIGDLVKIGLTRPISKRKHWVLLNIIKNN
ncbi:MAG: 30S ribosomal protein S17 [Bacteroides sp.]|nr:MAG: 30S ribosomal protein S17 [Bacteroides sp.]